MRRVQIPNMVLSCEVDNRPNHRSTLTPDSTGAPGLALQSGLSQTAPVFGVSSPIWDASRDLEAPIRSAVTALNVPIRQPPLRGSSIDEPEWPVP